MAEPDDVEEDLFADLYDGDDNHGSNANIPSVPPPAQSSSNDAAMKTKDVSGYGEEPEVAYEDVSFETEPHGQDELFNGNHHEMHVQDNPEMTPQHERYNVNMKEDG